MGNGLALAYNIPAFLGTLFLFFCFWIYFKIFSAKIERILVRNFGDNLKNLYWLRKGKKFLKVLIKFTIATLIFDYIIYFTFFYLHGQNSKYPENKNEIMTITLCFIIVIAWLYLLNWTLYFIIFIYNKYKHSTVTVNIEHLVEFNKIKDYRISNVGKNVLYNKEIEWKIKKYENAIQNLDFNKIIKYSLVLIEFYALMIDNNYFNEINDNEKYVKSNLDDSYLSRKGFLIRVNSYFNQTIIVKTDMI